MQESWDLSAAVGYDTRCATCGKRLTIPRRWCELHDADDNLLAVFCSWACTDPAIVVERIRRAG